MTAVRAQIEGETKKNRKRPQRGSKKQPAQARESVTSETEQRATNQEQESKPEPAPGAAGEPTTGQAVKDGRAGSPDIPALWLCAHVFS